MPAIRLPAALLLLHCALLAPTGAASENRDPRIAAVEQGLLPPVVTERTQPMRLADRMHHYKVPGLSVAVIDEGRIAWAASWGVAEAGQSEPLRPHTLMQAASISKPIAALGAMKLARQGKLALDQDVNAQLKRWKLPAAEKPEHAGVVVTPRLLLGHAAGLSVHGFRGYIPGEPLPATLIPVLDGKPPANNAPVRILNKPGTAWKYSGGGYVLLQQVMLDVSDEPFSGWMRREILKPFGMHQSFFGAWPDAPLHSAATGHQDGVPIAGKRGTLVELAAGGLWSNPTELAQLTLALQAVLAGKDHPVLSREELAVAMKPLLPGAPTGLGFMLENEGRIWGHDGRNAGFMSRWRADATRAVILMANADDAMGLMEEVIRAIAVAHEWKDLAPPRMKLSELAARYRLAPIHVRGTMNEWGLSLEPLKESPAGSGRWVTQLELAKGEHQFKFATADWKTVDLGRAESGTSDLAVAGENLRFTAPVAGRYQFELDASDPTQPKWRVTPAPATR